MRTVVNGRAEQPHVMTHVREGDRYSLVIRFATIDVRSWSIVHRLQDTLRRIAAFERKAVF
eukprot:COSAG02_NODE_56004_length_287_cov_1.372340_2_plen_60_part_01